MSFIAHRRNAQSVRLCQPCATPTQLRHLEIVKDESAQPGNEYVLACSDCVMMIEAGNLERSLATMSEVGGHPLSLWMTESPEPLYT